ncbi:hypothetical protein PHJA_002453400 [Phtheirospermum japonicum]|uniref:Uncharacterized protein n=1 Tax=Phtheirospermum japonicum TaxID=374723 RepID=A0A830D7I1_9LAMI|nr:hypothetical protein PHJA_002453400 [Phtheirospermum japonicum]
MIMRHHLKGLIKHLSKMIFFLVFVISVFIEITPAIATAELSSRDEMVKLAGYGEDKLSTVVIGGKLICHAAPNYQIPRNPISVSGLGRASLSRTLIVPARHEQFATHPYTRTGATVAVFCSTAKKSWAQGNTNSYGEFIIDVPSNLHAIPNLEKICTVEILRLPKSSPCGRAFTGKHKGIIKLSSIGGGVRLYTTDDIYLMPKPSGDKIEHIISVSR